MAVLICHRLKKLYRTHRETLGKTGAGLISENRDSEITAGSELDNIWRMFCATQTAPLLTRCIEKVQAEFPWYKRMDALMKNHPSIARDAVANSTTSVNTGVLDAAVRRTVREVVSHMSYGLHIRVRAMVTALLMTSHPPLMMVAQMPKAVTKNLCNLCNLLKCLSLQHHLPHLVQQQHHNRHRNVRLTTSSTP